MTEPVKAGLPLLGIVFLALAIFKFVQGESWVVWLILGIIFGGLRIFASKRDVA
ncbi:hypothetical protein [Sphingomonas sp. LT1P40]|uniref:hypothetical protein n=1 Tax=Alteristakelama amylovorans TaxID=3096166 RepID=UPI002FCB1CEE